MATMPYSPAAKAAPVTVRDLLHRNPVSFIDLLDLFEAYVATIDGPLTKATIQIEEELHYQGGDIFGHITGVAMESNDMAARLRQIRTARLAGADVSITLTDGECREIDTAIPDLIGLVNDTLQALDGLSDNLDARSVTTEGMATASTLRLLGRALRAADDIEIPALQMIDRKVRSAISARREAEKQSDLHKEELA